MRILLIAVMAVIPTIASAHCDGLDGPVVEAGRKALERGDIRPALAWVQPQDEAEIKTAFAKTLAVRKLGPEGRDLADRYFFETLVRVHRAGEGAPYTGLKPAGRDLGPTIPAADKAIAAGSADGLIKLISADVRSGIEQRFEHVLHTRDYDTLDTEAGRRYVKAYVEFIHYVEGIHRAGTREHADEH